jgi:hypothetical protein
MIDKSPADVLYHRLIEESDLTAENLFVAFLPDQPDESVAIFDTAGRQDGRLLQTGEQIIHPGIQIQVRDKDYSAGWERANDIALLLDGFIKEEVAIESDGIYILHNVSRTGDIIPVGIETVADRRRHLFTINAVVTISKQT